MLVSFALWHGSIAQSAELPRHTAEYNEVRRHGVSLGPEASRLIVGFRATAGVAIARTIHRAAGSADVMIKQAQTTPGDVFSVAARVHVPLSSSRQLTSSMHVMLLRSTLYGAGVEAALAALRRDPMVEFADVDQRRFPHSIPDDPLFAPSSDATGQWYLLTPDAAGDASATDAVSAWAVTTGSSGTVIADIDTGVRFDHPDLARAGLGGRLLPGYDFVGQDVGQSTSMALGTYLIANDGDGYDPDPSDPGDWLTAADEQNPLFPVAACGAPADSSWHGTRVMGILGAVTNNAVGIAGMTWKPYLLPVRALGKCGGYDSDIITALQWAAGMPVTGVPDNPYPADIINLSLGSTGTCPSAYSSTMATLGALGVLVVASAGNESGPVDAPANCPGVLSVAGLRNAGTKVGYSSLGPQVSVAAPAGNCINSSGPCLRSIDTTTNSGLTVPGTNGYTNQINPNLGTSFSAPIVSGIAALMRATNANLTPAALIARIRASATPFPQPPGLPVCPDSAGAECACPNDGSECGAGMVNAFNAVSAALEPIAAVVLPASIATGSNASFDASGSAAACGRSIAGYAWQAVQGVTILSGAQSPKVTVIPTSASATLNLTVTDSAGATDTVIINLSATTASTLAPAKAGNSVSACASDMTVTPRAPTISASFAPSSVNQNAISTLTITLTNGNGFALTQTSLAEMLPADVVIATTSASGTSLMPSTTCAGIGSALTNSASSVSLSGAIIPANGTCAVTVPTQSAAAGSYLNVLPAGAVLTGPAGGNSAPATAALTVNLPAKGGGGALKWWELLVLAGVVGAVRLPLPVQWRKR